MKKRTANGTIYTVDSTKLNTEKTYELRTVPAITKEQVIKAQEYRRKLSIDLLK